MKGASKAKWEHCSLFRRLMLPSRPGCSTYSPSLSELTDNFPFLALSSRVQAVWILKDEEVDALRFQQSLVAHVNVDTS
jgi:hypothetical protein